MSATASADGPRAPLIPTLVLSVAAGLGAMFVLVPLAFLLHPSTHLPGAGAVLGDQNQSVKTALYLVAYLAVVPVAAAAGPRIAEAIHARSQSGLSLLAMALAISLPGAVILARVCDELPWGGAVAVVLIVASCWWAAAVCGFVYIARRAPRTSMTPRVRVALSLLCGGLVIGAVLCVTSLHSLSWPVLLVGLAAIGATLFAHGRVRLPRIAGRKGLALDLILIALLLLAIPDVVIFKARTPLLTLLNANAIQGQENYLLGPANQVLAGGTMLVDTVSQYGVGSIYFLAGWFHIAPIGYGTLGFLDGVLDAFVFIAGYLLLRVAGASRLLAAAALAIGVASLLYHLTYPVGALAEHGPLRFGLPIAAILIATTATKSSRRVAAGLGPMVVVALASIWSIEAFAYSVFVVAAMAALWVTLLPAGTRRAWLWRQALRTAGLCLCAQLVLAAATLVPTGKFPDWGQYFSYFHAFLSGSVSNITYGFARWSPGLAVGALYLASAISLVLIARRRMQIVAQRPTPFIALAGATAYGIALFSYFDNRSATYLLLYVAFPALLVATLWLVVTTPLISTSIDWASRYMLAFALALATIVVAASWSSVGDRLSDSALAHVVPGGPSLGKALHRLWHPPALDPRSPVGERLLARYMPGRRGVLVLLPDAADVEVELLVRARRGNLLPIGDPIEDSIVPSARTALLRRSIQRLPAGTRILTNRSGLALLAVLRAHPTYDPLALAHPEGTGRLQDWALKEIDKRFALRTIATSSQGFVIAELVPRPHLVATTTLWAHQIRSGVRSTVRSASAARPIARAGTKSGTRPS